MKLFTLLSIPALFIFSSAVAQINKGSVLLGGNIQGSMFKQSGMRTTSSIDFRPAAGMAVKSNLIAGVLLVYSNGKNSPNGNYYDKYRTYGGGLFLRKYHPLGKNFYLFGEGQMYYTYFKGMLAATTTPPPTSLQYGEKVNALQMSLTPGLSYAVS